jgi:hypothetical protein
MLIYCTTISLTFKQVRRYAEITALEFGSGSTELIVAAPHLTPREQQAWADELWQREQAQPAYRYVVASTYEIPILRILRRIREKYDGTEDDRGIAEEFQTRVLLRRDPNEWLGVTLAEKIEARTLRAHRGGEFLDVWPDGFFMERMEELF